MLNPFLEIKMHLLVEYCRSFQMSTQEDVQVELQNLSCDNDKDSCEADKELSQPRICRSKWRIYIKCTVLEKSLLAAVFVLLVVVITLIAYFTARSRIVDDVCHTSSCTIVSGSLLSAMDPAADPCEDFVQYACGGWIKTHPIPEGHSSLNRVTDLKLKNEQAIKGVLEKPPASLDGEAEKKAKRYYMSCMDETGILEELGAQPLLDLIRSLGGWNMSSTTGKWDVATFDLNSFLQQLGQFMVFPFFQWGSLGGLHMIKVLPGGLTLNTPRWYFGNTTFEEDKHLGSLLKYMIRIGKLIGVPVDSDTHNQFVKLIQFEIQLAKIAFGIHTFSTTRRISRQNVASPVIDWSQFFNASSMSVSDYDIVVSPVYYRALNDLLRHMLQTEGGNNTLRNYMMWTVVHKFVPYLSSQFREALRLFQHAQLGIEGQRPRWRECVSLTHYAMKFAIGSMYVREAFNDDVLQKAQKITSEVEAVYKDRVSNIPWLEESPTYAEQEIESVNTMLGYPAYIKDPKQIEHQYESLNISKVQLFQNFVNSLRYDNEQQATRFLEKTPNKESWFLAPQEVDAYYLGRSHQIVIPAGILQNPFYDLRFPKSLEFATLGMVMGHEITHIFPTGSILNSEKACLVNQYSSYKINGKHVDGELTFFENIADGAGTHAAFAAYENWISENGDEQPLPGLNLTHKQLFFLGFAQLHCSSSTKEQTDLDLEEDLHSLPMYRIIGTLSNSRQFAKQFRCKAGARMNPEKKCNMW